MQDELQSKGQSSVRKKAGGRQGIGPQAEDATGRTGAGQTQGHLPACRSPEDRKRGLCQG